MDVPKLNLDVESREDIAAQLKIALQWITQQDEHFGISLDTLIFRLECLSNLSATRRLQSIIDERDAAREDLRRIGTIVSNPLKIAREDDPDSEH